MSDTLKRLEILYELKKYEELLHVSVPLCTSSSKSESKAYMYTILALIALKRYHEAVVYCQNALASFPHIIYFLYLNALINYHQKAYKEALSLIKNVLSYEPNVAIYHHLHAKILLERETYVEAKRSIDIALALEPEENDFLITLALITHHLGNTPIACEIISSVLSSEPYHTGALHLKSLICTSVLMEKGKILQSILFHNPFDTYGKEHLTHIKRYYQIAPALMLAFLLYGTGQFLGMWEKSSFSSNILLLLSFYVWKDWRLSLPFFAMSFMLLGSVSWNEWYVVPIGTAIYYIIGKIGGQIIELIVDWLKKSFKKAKNG